MSQFGFNFEKSYIIVYGGSQKNDFVFLTSYYEAIKNF